MNLENEVRVLVLGVSGMLGNTVLRYFFASEGLTVFGTARSATAPTRLPQEVRERLICGVEAESTDSLLRAFTLARPTVVINCVGLVKQIAEANDPIAAISINALLPHRLARLSRAVGARLIHMSTDCVFSGSRGMYREQDTPDAEDLYGRSKWLGELNCQDAITLRTSIIGHELNTMHGLVAWFLSQRSSVKGFRRAIFSGLPAVEIARVIRDYVIPNPDLHGLYHVASEPINKYELLHLIARSYSRSLDIAADDAFVIDRSLDATRFNQVTGYTPPSWPDLVHRMSQFR